MRPTFRSKNEVVYETLHRGILNGEYQPGERLVIDELSNTLGVSQIPIREALRQLEADGFVTIEPYVGATVTAISADTIFEIFALLETMEVLCGRNACRCMDDEELEIVSNLVRKMESSVDDPDQWAEDNQRFHLLICDYAQTGLIKGIMVKVFDHWDRLRRHFVKDVLWQRIVIAQEEHRQILEALCRRDADEVERLFRLHNRNALNAYIQHLQSAGHLEKSLAGC